MRKIISHLGRLDWVLLGAVALLFLFGLLMLYASPAEHNNFLKQAIFGVFALVVIVGLSFFDYRVLRDSSIFSVLLYVGGIVLLGLVLILGTQIRGVASWLLLGAVSVQPVEIVKIIVLIVLARYLSRRHIELYRLRHLFMSGVYILIPAAMVLVQPDLGSAVVLVASWVGLVFLSGIRAKQVALIIFLGITVLVLLWSFGLKPYQKERVISFLDPNEDPLGSSYQTRQAIIALGSGGVFGKGLGEGSQTRLGFLPEFRSDFIFAAIGEEWGLVGAGFVLVLWGIVFWRLYRLWQLSDNNFGRLFVGGVFILLFTHAIINVGTNLALLPVTGLPLPFVSYGGSNLVSCACALGVIMSIRARLIPSATYQTMRTDFTDEEDF